ncbi:rhodanese-like domain-containing protein [Limibacter armeniacum]|uniref:rhodanese-like domain-containing protein n=1 Tax=Limibacter armeniacum TaxID=466084 RepID=UPI002FE673E7
MKKVMTFGVPLLVLLMAVVWQSCSMKRWAYYKLLNEVVPEKVPYINVSEVNAQYHLLDARSEEEYEVSHLEGARRIDFDSIDTSVLDGIPKSDTVVVYCSVGYRSSVAGEALKELGYINVYNLYGGIFEWAAHDSTLVGNGAKVHPYNWFWGLWRRSCP